MADVSNLLINIQCNAANAVQGLDKAQQAVNSWVSRVSRVSGIALPAIGVGALYHAFSQGMEAIESWAVRVGPMSAQANIEAAIATERLHRVVGLAADEAVSAGFRIEAARARMKALEIARDPQAAAEAITTGVKAKGMLESAWETTKAGAGTLGAGAMATAGYVLTPYAWLFSKAAQGANAVHGALGVHLNAMDTAAKFYDGLAEMRDSYRDLAMQGAKVTMGEAGGVADYATMSTHPMAEKQTEYLRQIADGQAGIGIVTPH